MRQTSNNFQNANNDLAIFILLRVLAKMSQRRKKGRALNPLNKLLNNRPNFSGEKKKKKNNKAFV